MRIVILALLFPFFCFAAGRGEKKAPLASYVTAPSGAPTIILDAGHGGADLGARAKPPYCEEKRLCLQMTRLVRKYLNQLGYHVVMTRNSDAFVPLSRRVEIADQASGDLFVSVHCNSSRTPMAKGIEIFFFDDKEEKTRASSSKKLADAVLGRVLRRTLASSRGVKKGNFFVIRETTMPAILVESGFLSNSEERSALRSRDYQEKIARGIADGIDHFLKRNG